MELFDLVGFKAFIGFNVFALFYLCLWGSYITILKEKNKYIEFSYYDSFSIYFIAMFYILCVHVMKRLASEYIILCFSVALFLNMFINKRAIGYGVRYSIAKSMLRLFKFLFFVGLFLIYIVFIHGFWVDVSPIVSIIFALIALVIFSFLHEKITLVII